jgi:hypothetical protein
MLQINFSQAILFQHSNISYNIKVIFGEFSDIFKSYFVDLFLDVGAPSLFSKVNESE